MMGCSLCDRIVCGRIDGYDLTSKTQPGSLESFMNNMILPLMTARDPQWLGGYKEGDGEPFPP